MDIHTLHAVHLVLLLLYTILTFVNTRLHAGIAGVRWFTIYNLCTLLSTSLFGLRGQAPNLVSISLACWLGIIAYMTLYLSVADFFDKRIVSRTIQIVFCAVSLVLLVECGTIHPVTSTRLEIYSSLLALEQGFTAIYIYRRASGTIRTAGRLLTVMLSTLCLINCAQVIGVFLYGAPDQYLMSGPFLAWIMLLNITLQGGVMVAFIWLTAASLRRELEIQASTDFLTGLLNRRAIGLAAKKHIKHSKEFAKPVSAILIDLDQFKGLNDSLGHQCGDAILVAISNCLRLGLRKTDLLSRLGGDEFAILLLNTQLRDAVELAERLRAALEQLEITYQSTRIEVSASFGVAEIGDLNDWEDLISRCDTALYEVKKAGGNLVLASSSNTIHGVGKR